MKKGHSTSRRNFLSLSAGGAAALAIGGPGVKSVFGATTAAWTPTIPINPNLDPTKVVYCQHNATTNKMMLDTSASAAATFHTQNAALDGVVIRSNMDSMAITLCGGNMNANAAWERIFQFPAKPRNEVKVFIKTNGTVSTIMAHIPVVSKVCEELIRLGVQGSNITISDPGRGAGGDDKYTPYINNQVPPPPKAVYPTIPPGAPRPPHLGLPNGVKVSTERYPQFTGGTGRTGGKTPNIPIGDGTQQVWCTRDIVVADANGTLTYVADMVINLAVNKGHPHKPQIADLTLSMKNHVGTFAVWAGDPNDLLACPGDAAFNGGQPGGDFLIALNTSEAIMGSGPGYPVRQHLVIMDSLWACIDGPHFKPDCVPGFLAMGICSGAMDYLMHHKVRLPIMGAPALNAQATGVLNKFVTTFGLQPSQLQWIKAGTNVGIDNNSGRGNSLNSNQVTVMTGSNERVKFTLEGNDLAGARVNVYDIGGKLIRELGDVGGRSNIVWDGKNLSGGNVPAGKYIVKLWSGNRAYAKTLSIVN